MKIETKRIKKRNEMEEKQRGMYRERKINKECTEEEIKNKRKGR